MKKRRFLVDLLKLTSRRQRPASADEIGEIRRLDIDPSGDGLFALALEGPEADATLIFFHGGGWVDGSPQMSAWMGPVLDPLGINTLLPSYRVNVRDGTSVEEAVDDAVRAAEALRGRSTGLNRLLIGGASAGGLLALHVLRRAKPFDYAGLLLVNPVTDLGLGGFRNRLIPPEGKPELSPLDFVGEMAPVPTLLLHPPEDAVVPISDSERFLAAWNNSSALLDPWPATGGHGSFNLARNQRDFAGKLRSFVDRLISAEEASQ